MKVLGIETATTVCAAAVASDGTIAAESWLDHRNVHAEKLLGLIDTVLLQSKRSLSALDGIAVSIGPGSFTGLRIGLSVAKGLVYATGTPLLAVPTLQALAQKAVDAGAVPTSGCVLPMLDARRDEVYCQLFSVNNNDIAPIWDERDVTLADLLRELGDRDVTVTGDAHQKLSRELGTRSPARTSRIRFVDAAVARCSAGTVALLGERLLQQGRVEDPAALEPRYIKEFFFKAR